MFLKEAQSATSFQKLWRDVHSVILS